MTYSGPIGNVVGNLFWLVGLEKIEAGRGWSENINLVSGRVKWQTFQ
jgi:hypothetical protein